jgi:hypothetical protein
VPTPVTAKPKSTCMAILRFYGADTKNMSLPDLVRQVAASIRDHGTKALLLGDIARLRMHRADEQDVLDLIRAFMSMHVTLSSSGWTSPAPGCCARAATTRAPASGSSRPPGTPASTPWRPPDGCREAIDTGTERLTRTLLDNVALSLPDAGSRDAKAGEIPAIPPGPARPGCG